MLKLVGHLCYECIAGLREITNICANVVHYFCRTKCSAAADNRLRNHSGGVVTTIIMSRNCSMSQTSARQHRQTQLMASWKTYVIMCDYQESLQEDTGR